MKTKLYFLSLILASVGFTGCEKDDIDTYNETCNAVRFTAFDLVSAEKNVGGSGYISSDQCWYSSFSFLDEPFAESHNCVLNLSLIGTPMSHDAQVNYEIDTERTTAPEGSFEILEAKIPANEIYGQILVNVKNVEALQDETYELYLHLKPSTDLALGPKEYLTAYLSWNNQIKEPTVTHHVRTYNMLIKSPLSFISTSKSYYSPNALKAIVAALGWDDWDDYSVHGSKYNNATTYLGYKYLPRYNMIYSDSSYKGYASKLRMYLEAYEKENGAPLLHDAGLYKGQPIEARSY